MSETGPGATGMKAEAALTQYRAVKITGEHLVNAITDAAAERPIGIVQNDPAINAAVEIGVYGHTVRAEYGGSVSAGEKLRSNDSGQLIADDEVISVTRTVDVHHIAIALENGSSGEIHDVLAIQPQIVGLKA